MKTLAIVACLVAAGLAIGVYRAKLGAEDAEARIETLDAGIRQAREDISVLKAEEAYLSRPERIGPLARERLGLTPASPSQFTAEEALGGRLGGERITLPPQPAARAGDDAGGANP